MEYPNKQIDVNVADQDVPGSRQSRVMFERNLQPGTDSEMAYKFQLRLISTSVIYF